MHKHNLYLIIGSLITINTCAMEELPKNNISMREVPSLRTTAINAIVAGYGNTDSERQKTSAQFIIDMQKNDINGSPLVDEYTMHNCTNAYIRQHCWTADTGNGINHIRTENGILLKKLLFTKAFEDHEFTPLLAKNKYTKNSYITGKNNNLCIIDMQTKQITKELVGHTQNIKCYANTNQNEILLSGACDGTIKIWNLKTNQLIKTLSNLATPRNLAANEDSISSLDWKNPTLTIWDLLTCRTIFSKTIGNLNQLHPISLMMKDNMIYIGLEGKMATIAALDPRSGKAHDWRAHTCRITSLIPCKQDTNLIYSCSLDGSIKQWDQRKTSACIKKIHFDEEKNSCFHIEGIYETKDGKKIFATDSNNIFICNVTANTLQLRTRLYLDHKAWITSNSITMNDEETELYIPTHYKGIMTVTPHYIADELNELLNKK